MKNNTFNLKTTVSADFDLNVLEHTRLRNKNIAYIKTDNCIGAVLKKDIIGKSGCLIILNQIT